MTTFHGQRKRTVASIADQKAVIPDAGLPSLHRQILDTARLAIEIEPGRAPVEDDASRGQPARCPLLQEIYQPFHGHGRRQMCTAAEDGRQRKQRPLPIDVAALAGHRRRDFRDQPRMHPHVPFEQGGGSCRRSRPGPGVPGAGTGLQRRCQRGPRTYPLEARVQVARIIEPADFAVGEKGANGCAVDREERSQHPDAPVIERGLRHARGTGSLPALCAHQDRLSLVVERVTGDD
ncbi:hypothetical protein D9M72_445810 [compost metagenome]